jgi:CRISPR-associated protein Cas1
MTERILDFSEEAARLSVKHRQLVVVRGEAEQVTVPLEEIAAVLIAHPQVVATQAALSGIALAGGVVVICDERRMPAAMLLPLEGHSVQAERFALQANSAVPQQKQLWRQLVRAKIAAQARVLSELHEHDQGLLAMSGRVKSGDSGNLEAQASRRYWPALFGDPEFRRDPGREDQNRLLNYGYGVLRALTARAICATGLHPAIGLHHHNRYDAFRLADDLMEPFRPKVDRAVALRVRELGPDCPLDRAAKQALVGALMAREMVKGESRSLFDALTRVAASLSAVYEGQRKTLILPEE